jgi:hypothetical protein
MIQFIFIFCLFFVFWINSASADDAATSEYWYNRGPSVHAVYDTSLSNEPLEYFYNEAIVPLWYDPVGTYAMATGFAEGYFGMQVNSDQERRILFSIWSTYETDDPSRIPEDEKVILVKKWNDVQVNEFWDEGSGGQSYLVYPWEAGKKYKFLVHARPNWDGSTTYSWYFHAPEMKKWMFIASWKRQKTSSYLTGLYSFLENFDEQKWHLSRKALFSNPIIVSTSKKIQKIDSMAFSWDAIAQEGKRKDFAGGVEGKSFFLKNGWYFTDFTPLGSIFQIK